MLRFAIIIAVIVAGCAVYIAIQSGDPHWVNRGGALITAISAFLAISDATLEHKILEEKINKPNQQTKIGNVFDLTLSRISSRVAGARFREQFSGLSQKRLKTVFWISGLAVLGEILHGFGDLGIAAAEAIVSQ